LDRVLLLAEGVGGIGRLAVAFVGAVDAGLPSCWRVGGCEALGWDVCGGDMRMEGEAKAVETTGGGRLVLRRTTLTRISFVAG